MKKEALLFARLPGAQVRCRVCQRGCIIPDGGKGWCRTRVNEGGTLYSLIYGEVSSISVNPIEKKPVFHYCPGSKWLSLGSWGCNFRCPGCQNWEIAHVTGEVPKEGRFISPEEQVEMALRNGCLGLSWTFNEPTLWLEYTLEAARLAKERGLRTNYVTNGFMSEEALATLAPYLDVYRMDLKGFSKETYEAIASIEEFRGILEVAGQAKGHGMHVEVVTNLIPGLNDDERELQGMASWILDNLGRDTPWHVTRFHPHLRLSHLTPTPVSALERARKIGLQSGLRYVYLGNVPGHKAENTYCPECKELLIRRYVFDILENRIEDGRCPTCRATIAGRF